MEKGGEEEETAVLVKCRENGSVWEVEGARGGAQTFLSPGLGLVSVSGPSEQSGIPSD